MSTKIKCIEIDKKLMKFHIDISEFSKLNLVCAYGFTRELQVLIKKRINLNQEDKVGITPLIIASMLGYTRLHELLIQNGANINHANKYGMTPLHIAACYGHVETVKLLIKYGANKNAESIDNITPYDLIKKKYSSNYLRIVELLK
jgi:ankyrin repeat protein